jgi:hypothetical protein
MAAIPASEMTQAVEFYHSGLDHYFISANTAEIGDLDTGVHPGWARTGYQFAVIKAGSTLAGTSPVCRFYGIKISSHFYSAKPSECEDVKVKFPNAWAFEAPEVFRAFLVDTAGNCAPDTTPVYRLYNNRADVNHRYTDRIAVFQYMVGKGYLPEGDGNPALPVAFCSPNGGSIAPAPPATAPNCTVTGTTATPAVGSTLNLSATCTNAPTGFLWTGCTSTTSACAATKATSGAASYTVYASNAQGPGAPVTLNVNWTGGAGALPICTLSASLATPSTGSPLTLTANCSQSPNNYDWLQCSYLTQALCNIMPACASSSTTCVVNNANAGYAHYSIAASNTSGTGPRSVGVDVEWKQGSSGGGGGGPNPDPIPVCSAFASDVVPLVNTSIVLFSNCSGNPTSYTWTGVSCSGSQCAASSSSPGVVTYSVTAGNFSGNSTSYVAVEWKTVATNPTPACTLSASNTSPVLGSAITITSSCTNSPTTYTWTGCSSAGASCNDTVNVAGNKTYTLVASNGNGAGNTAVASVNWTAPPTSPPACSISASTTTPVIGQNVTLTASCNASPTSYVWTGCVSTTSTCVTTAATAGPATYYVAGVNTFGIGNVAGVVVTWATSGGGGGGGGGGPSFCGSYNNVKTTTIAWGDNSRKYTKDMGGFAYDGVIVMQFTVPASPPIYATAGNTTFVEYQDPPTFRHMTLSKSACDFRAMDSSGTNGPMAVAYGNLADLDFNVGSPPVTLVPGQTYFMNWRNYSPDLPNGGLSCFGASCNGDFVTNWPR